MRDVHHVQPWQLGGQHYGEGIELVVGEIQLREVDEGPDGLWERRQPAIP